MGTTSNHRLMKRTLSVVAVGAAIAACNGSVSDYAGSYTGTLTAEDDQCTLPGWTNGASFNNSPITITTDPSDIAIATIQFGGAFGDFMSSYVATTRCDDAVQPDGFSCHIYGGPRIAGGDPSCGGGSPVEANIFVKLDGDTIVGNVDFLRNCPVGCASELQLTATRPTR